MKKLTTPEQAYDHIKSVLSEKEFDNLRKAADAAVCKEITDGFSISAARDKYNEVRSLLAFLLCHKDTYVKKTAEKIMKTADENSSKGLFDHEGKTIFLID